MSGDLSTLVATEIEGILSILTTANAATESESELLSKIFALVGAIETEHRAFDSVCKEAIGYVRDGRTSHFRAIEEHVDKFESALIKEFEELEELLESAVAEAALTSEHVEQRAEMVLIVASAVVIISSLALALWLTRSITKPIYQVIESMQQGARQVSEASSMVSQSSQAMAEGASEQASSIEETSASLQEMSAMTSQNASNAKLATAKAHEATQATSDGQVAVK